jgi:tetratricopeptide (TPR) repeat protein
MLSPALFAESDRKNNMTFRASSVCSSVLLLTTLVFNPMATGLGAASQGERQRAFELWEKSNFAEAIPILEKLADNPDTAILSRLGFALYATSMTIKDDMARRKQLDRAREMLRRSQQMGDDSNLTQITLDALSSNDATQIPFSDIREAEAAIREGEAAYVQGDLDRALAAYERALKFDPKLYDAALYAGDMYFKKGHGATDPKTRDALLDKSGAWFARAIAIDANRETAYRYWGDALMLQQKNAEARTKFVDAIVAEPYSRRAYVGLTQWAGQVKATLSHPEIKQPPPSMRSTQEQDRATITMDPKALDPKQGVGYYWSLYDLVRSTYKSAGFKKDFPNERQYRHTLKEEASALQAVAETAARDLKEGKLKSDDPSLANLIRLWNAGLVEAYILFARPDEGIVLDYVNYRQNNRDKLRRYWLEFVIGER